MDESVNKTKKEKILRFLQECQTGENQLLDYYWNNFNEVIEANTWITFYTNRHVETNQRLKFHHYMQVLHLAYMNLKSLEMKIMKAMYFRFDDKEKQKVYNYCKGFCFDWKSLKKYVNKQINEFKKQDKNYYDFLLNVNNYILDKKKYNQMKQDIQNKFYEVKSKFKLPIKKEYQIHCNTFHTVDIQIKEFQWIFIIDNNDIIGGTEKKPKFDTLIIPVKFSSYHREILKDKQLNNTFNLRLNKYGKIEIIGSYEIDINKIEPTPNNIIGIDIGLKKLITCSDGEIVEQNEKIIKRAKKLVIHQANRQTLEEHLKIKLKDKNFKLLDKNYMKRQIRLSTFVKTDNRYRIKQFLRGREHDHIIMENLDIGYSKTYSKEANYLLKRMKIQNIKSDLIEYCQDLGITTSLINPAFTSQLCPVCGHIDKKNRPTQEMFCCVKCGHTDNADHNASINIKERFKDNRIKLNTPFWRVKEILNVVE